MTSNAAEYFKTLSPVKGDSHRKSEHNSKSGPGRCHCCPYGYHIDLDFVRYCQTLNQKNENPALAELKKRKRARRRQTKSMEAMLGLSNSHHNSTKNKIGQEGKISEECYTSYSRRERRKKSPPSPPPRRQSLFHPALKSPPPPDIVNSSTLIQKKRNEQASEALQEAVQDFEELLESSRSLTKRKTRHQNGQTYPSIDLLNNMNSVSRDRPFITPSSVTKPNGTSLGRSNSLPRQLLYDSPFISRNQSTTLYKDSPYGMMTRSFTSTGFVNQTPLMSDALATLNAGHAYPDSRLPDFDTMSVTSGMSGVSTTTLQSIRDQMATGLSRLRELEHEVKGYPNMMIKLDILREEKRIMLEELQNVQNGQEVSTIIPLFIDKDIDSDIRTEDLETRLETLRKFSISRQRRKLDRKRSQSPLRVNLQDFYSYRRARKSSMSEGSDCESLYGVKTRDREEGGLFINEFSDCASDSSRPLRAYARKMKRDASVNCSVHTRDVGVSRSPTRNRSVGTLTDVIHESASKLGENTQEITIKRCSQCNKLGQNALKTRSVGTDSPLKSDLDDLSLSSLSVDSVDIDERSSTLFQESKEIDISSVNPVVHRMGEKSPIINRLSSPQMHPPVLSFDNSTNTDARCMRDRSTNVSLETFDLFTADQLNELIADARQEWETARKSEQKESSSVKKITRDRGIQAVQEIPRSVTQNVGVMVRPITKDFGFSPTQHEKKVKSVGCSADISVKEETPKVSKPTTRSVAIGDGKLDDNICSDCENRRNVHVRSVGCGFSKITDILCDKCDNYRCRNVGVGDCKITDELCTKCASKKSSKLTQTLAPPSKSVGVDVIPDSSSKPAITPESEKHAFGSSRVNICDKCHEKITIVAKDMVNITGPDASTAVINQPSKIPRLVEYAKTEEIFSTDTKPDICQTSSSSFVKGHTEMDSIASLGVEKGQKNDRSPKRPDKLPLRTNENDLSKINEMEDLQSQESSMNSPCQPTFSSSPQVKRNVYTRQQTYTKAIPQPATFSNEALDNNSSKSGLGENTTIHSPSKGKTSPNKPLRKKALTKTKTSESGEKRGGDAFSSTSSSDEEGEEGSSLAASSIAVTNLTSSLTSLDDPSKPRKKSQPSRGMRAALKVLNDSIGKPVRSNQQLSNALNIVQKEWFKISSGKEADPTKVEEYMDAFEEYSRGVLQRVVNLSDVNGNSAMHYAVSHGNFDVVSVLLDSKVCNVNQQNTAGYTATMLVALARIRSPAHEGVVKKLFDSGDVNIKASQHGQTALMLAVSHGRLDMVRMLAGSGADPNIQDEDGSTALMCAAEHGHTAIVRFLLGLPDTDLYLTDHDGSTALTIAVEAGHKDVGVLLYKQMNLSRGSSPYSSIRAGKRSKTPTFSRSAMTPPRGSAPVSPGPSRKSSGRASPANPHGSSASLSNLIL